MRDKKARALFCQPEKISEFWADLAFLMEICYNEHTGSQLSGSV